MIDLGKVSEATKGTVQDFKLDIENDNRPEL